jgi:hypothetical protein
MQRHQLEFEVEATPEEIWQVFWGPRPRVVEHGDVRTRLTFTETYHVFYPVMRALLERPVHRSISRENDRLLRAGVDQGLTALRRQP